MHEYYKLRQQTYQPTIRGEFVKFIQNIHDFIRIGEVKKLTTPISAYWSITNKCNLSCKHCYANKYISNKKDLNFEEVKYISDILKKQNILEIILQGGEPFCYNNINDFIIYLKKLGFAITILTNGTNLTSETINILNSIMTPIDIMQVSIDGNQEANDLIRGKGVYTKVLSFLEKVQFSNIVVNCVVTNENINNLDEMISDIFKIKHIQEVHFSPLMKIGKGKNFDVPSMEKCMNKIKEYKKLYSNKITGTMISDYIFLEEEVLSSVDFSNIKLGCCAGRSKIFINPKGYIYSCEFRQSPSPKNIFLEDFCSIWNSEWNEQIDKTYEISKSMRETAVLEKFCPNMI